MSPSTTPKKNPLFPDELRTSIKEKFSLGLVLTLTAGIPSSIMSKNMDKKKEGKNKNFQQMFHSEATDMYAKIRLTGMFPRPKELWEPSKIKEDIWIVFFATTNRSCGIEPRYINES
jgi:hypothetical protein